MVTGNGEWFAQVELIGCEKSSRQDRLRINPQGVELVRLFFDDGQALQDAPYHGTEPEEQRDGDLTTEPA